MKKYNIKDIKDWYKQNKKKEVKYLAIHIETEEQHVILKEFMPELNDWEDRHSYYLQSGGYAQHEFSYRYSDYFIIEFDNIIFEQEYEIY